MHQMRVYVTTLLQCVLDQRSDVLIVFDYQDSRRHVLTLMNPHCGGVTGTLNVGYGTATSASVGPGTPFERPADAGRTRRHRRVPHRASRQPDAQPRARHRQSVQPLWRDGASRQSPAVSCGNALMNHRDTKSREDINSPCPCDSVFRTMRSTPRESAA